MSRELTLPMQKFVREYLVDRNGTQAAIRAGYSPVGAGVTANRLLKMPKIAAEIAKVTGKALQSLDISVERVLQERARLSFFDIRKVVNSDGSPKALHELDDDTAAAIAGVDCVMVGNAEMGVGQVLKFKMADKSANLAALERHLGIGKNEEPAGVLNIVLNLG